LNGKTIMANANTPFPQDADPFFWLSGDRKWNACIGRQGAEENYVDGYIEAAIELASAVIEKKMYTKRDTLVMPILYNARHALELSLKYAIKKLYATGVIRGTHPINHDIMSHWAMLNASELGDEALRECVTALKPYVASLSQIDDDGQQLRYSENREGQKSLADRSLANIGVIRTSLGELNRVLQQLKYRVLDLISERVTGSYTAECSRRDLLEIASLLPQAGDWSEPAFVEAKTKVMKRFDLSGRKFSKAVDVITGNREMRCLIGLKTSLAHLSDQNALFVVGQWASLYPARLVGGGLRFVHVGEIGWDDPVAEDQIIAKIAEVLTPDEIADLETIYYIGRDAQFCEHYEQNLESTREQHRANGDLAMELNHLMDKTNFQEALASGVSKLGRPDLADELRAIGRGVVAG
jgi:hypothetical protein